MTLHHHTHKHPLRARDISLTTDTILGSQTAANFATTKSTSNEGLGDLSQALTTLQSSTSQHLETVYVTQTTMLSELPTDSAELSLLLDSLVSQGGYYAQTNMSSSGISSSSFFSSITQVSGTSGSSSSEPSSTPNSTQSSDIISVTSLTTSTATEVPITSSEYFTLTTEYVEGTGDTVTETTTESPATLPLYSSTTIAESSNFSSSMSGLSSSSSTSRRSRTSSKKSSSSSSSWSYPLSTEYAPDLTTIYPDYISAGTPYYSTHIEYTQPFYVTDSLTTFNVEVPITTTAYVEIPEASSTASFSHPAVITTDLADFRTLHKDYLPDSLKGSSKSGLTRASVAGIAVGCTIGVIMALLFGAWFFFFRGKCRFGRTDSMKDLTDEKNGEFSDNWKNGNRGAYGTFDVDRSHDYSPAVPIIPARNNDSTPGNLAALSASPFAPVPPPPRKNGSSMGGSLPVVYVERETNEFQKPATPVVADTLASFKIAGGKIRSIRPTKSSSDGSLDSEGRSPNTSRTSSGLHSSASTTGNGSNRSSSSSLGANTSTDHSSSSNFSSDFDDIDTL